MGAKAAIVTTLKDADMFVDDFVRYHVALGFARIYLFFDDPTDPTAIRFAEHPSVTVIRNDSALREMWSDLAQRDSRYRRALRLRDRTHEWRQQLNVGVAMQLAKRDGCDWLLHIDIDELFHVGRAKDASDYFAELTQLDLSYALFYSFEAIPTESDSVFRKTVLFKVCQVLLSDAQLAWFRRTFPNRLSFFWAYASTKAAVRLGVGDPFPASQHRFLPKNLSALERYVWRVGLYLLSTLAPTAMGMFVLHSAAAQATRDAVILHYPCPTFSYFEKRYKARLPNAKGSNMLFGGLKTLKTYVFAPFELGAYDAVRGGTQSARTFYEQQVFYAPNEVEALMARGLVRQIEAPATLLRDP